MSVSPPIRRRSMSSAAKQEELINAYEAEEERIINVLSRKLEQLRRDKIDLENALEVESESHVNRLTRELNALRMAQQQQQAATNGSSTVSPAESRNGTSIHDPGQPSTEVMLDAMRRENDQLRNRLTDIEKDYIRLFRLNEIYREELIEHRNRLGQPVDNLIGMSSADPYSQPLHRRASSYSNGSVSPTASTVSRPSPSVPIPRPPSLTHRPTNNISESSTPSVSSSLASPSIFSPMDTTHTSYISNNTTFTSPQSSGSYQQHPQFSTTPSRNLTYPSVPPPSLSSSFGSPTISYHMGYADHSGDTSSVVSRRSSGARRGRVAESGSLHDISRSHSQSRRESLERNGGVQQQQQQHAHAGVGRRSSQNLPSTNEVLNEHDDEEDEVFGLDRDGSPHEPQGGGAAAAGAV
ncbi:hypothetical protein FISHEDRAFT_61393 [Fistulina hepatica ATCC 64428]|uniref:Uncharacterized protein n=1 Tax=Fistulina hepatica ATCC 64428 TaxID=1128425 RepID=A0A0D7A566_9AGAR|nr:hypothetical protein FISHEDRAFT_61393 [Fistulina hepatica ATCC 64428]